MREAEILFRDHESEFRKFFELLVTWNERMNLTAITAWDDVWVKHFVDSLLVVETDEWKQRRQQLRRVADVGTGAGFPGIPLAICMPDVEFVLFDSLQKRVHFLSHVCAELGLRHVRAVHGRAEDVGRDNAYRNRFDAVVSRAVARLNILAEYTMPLAAVGGAVYAYKGPGVDEELAEGTRAAALLGGAVTGIHRTTLGEERAERTIVVMVQQKPTPKAYPRKSGIPKKQPL
ncbi:ribosomal RNA small subunit methyltransferase G [Alicyclobacillus contaminans]|uniref:16S rRNA (guanine(527)-N(7))-methyltransferase RsmG n=1 Tax=Alicyclobacillus contaminans TaxID=392016 RepID=UPI0004201EDB|nr:16S rRNA (guanine(527)-N(7))-methyltransferase RsmG [Alicyclobacillus contaminans]GMA50749.1 ribosomal RNA small subunit methyltransferase G [Alicyclobacillus contaminans]